MFKDVGIDLCLKAKELLKINKKLEKFGIYEMNCNGCNKCCAKAEKLLVTANTYEKR